MVYCKNMLESVKIYTSDKFWPQILTDLGAVLVDNPNLADVNFDNVDLDSPVSVVELKNIICQVFCQKNFLVHIFVVFLPRKNNKYQYVIKITIIFMLNWKTCLI